MRKTLTPEQCIEILGHHCWQSDSTITNAVGSIHYFRCKHCHKFAMQKVEMVEVESS